MKYIKSSEIAAKWKVSERSVRNYCAEGRVPGAYLDGKTWMIAEDANKPERKTRFYIVADRLLDVLRREKEAGLRGSIYHKLQIDMTYNTNHIEGSKLTHEQTRYIFETNTIAFQNEVVNVDDIIETVNHFACIDLVIDLADKKLTESMVKQFHLCLKKGTSDSKNNWFHIGDYKLMPNEVGGHPTSRPSEVKKEIVKLLEWYHSINKVKIEDIIEFHQRFEEIHPFQDGNGRVGRLIMLKECLKYNLVPILITDDDKYFYYRGLKEWHHEKGYLIDTCLHGQDIMKKYLNAFQIICD